MIDERLLPRRYVLLAVASALFCALWLDWSRAEVGGDWVAFIRAARLFTTAPSFGDVVGPVTLVVVYPFTLIGRSVGWIICSALCMMLGLVTIRCFEQTAAIAGFGTQRDRERAVLVGGFFFIYAWSIPGARFGHVDDVLALTFVAVVARALVGGRWLLAALAMAVAIDAKPWAALALPLVAACSGARLRGLVVTGVAAALPWIPFLVLQHGHLGDLNLPVATDSDLHYLGVAVSASPGWPRLVQLAVALPLATYAVAKHKWYLVPVIVFAIRINLDPETYGYYMTGAVFGLFLWDVMKPARAWGMRTALGCIALVVLPVDLRGLNGYTGISVDVVLGLRLLAAVAPLAVLFGVTFRPFRREPGNLT